MKNRWLDWFRPYSIVTWCSWPELVPSTWLFDNRIHERLLQQNVAMAFARPLFFLDAVPNQRKLTTRTVATTSMLNCSTAPQHYSTAVRRPMLKFCNEHLQPEGVEAVRGSAGVFGCLSVCVAV